MPFVKTNGLPLTSYRILPGKIYSNATKSATLYLNGVLVTADLNAQAGIGNHQSDASNDLWIGAYFGNSYWNGTIDEVSIWNRSLSAEEILDIYKRGTLRLNLSVRTSDDNITWSSWVNVSNPSNLIDPSARYITGSKLPVGVPKLVPSVDQLLPSNKSKFAFVSVFANAK